LPVPAAVGAATPLIFPFFVVNARAGHAIGGHGIWTAGRLAVRPSMVVVMRIGASMIFMAFRGIAPAAPANGEDPTHNG